jgi:hypothetical protein
MMTTFERPRLTKSVESELSIFAEKARRFAEQMSEHESAKIRAQDVAVLAIEFFDMVDGIDHRTSSEMGGTTKIQDFAQLNRQAAREFTKRLSDID